MQALSHRWIASVECFRLADAMQYMQKPLVLISSRDGGYKREGTHRLSTILFRGTHPSTDMGRGPRLIRLLRRMRSRMSSFCW